MFTLKTRYPSFFILLKNLHHFSSSMCAVILVACLSMLSLNGIFWMQNSLICVPNEFYQFLSYFISQGYKAVFSFTPMQFIPQADFLLHLLAFRQSFIQSYFLVTSFFICSSSFTRVLFLLYRL